jgi:hypothetical protein
MAIVLPQAWFEDAAPHCFNEQGVRLRYCRRAKAEARRNGNIPTEDRRRTRVEETFESEAKDWAVFTSSLIFASSLPSLYEFRLQ